MELQSILIALTVGVASGSIGSFVILRRMALVGDALAHVALPGIALAIAYKIDPFWGVVVFLLGAAVIVWWLETRTRLPAEALVGLLFISSLAIGILTIPDTEILESLFGSFSFLPFPLLILFTAAAMLAVFFTFILTRKFLFVILSPDLAKVNGIREGTNLIFLIIFGFVVALGIKLVGALLMGALTMIPALAAKNLCRTMKQYMILSAVTGGLIGLGGVFMAGFYDFLPGPAIVLFGIAVFFISLFFQKASRIL